MLFLTAIIIRENFEPSNRVAILVRDSRRAETTQRITSTENAVSSDFQAWLRHKNVTSDVYIGMNSLKRDAQSRTKEDIEEIRHLYLDIDRRGSEALDVIRNSSVVPAPNYVLETSPGKLQVIWNAPYPCLSHPRPLVFSRFRTGLLGPITGKF